MWNSSARIEKNEDADTISEKPWITKGNVTEQGIFQFFMNLEGGKECLDKKKSLTKDLILDIIPFSSSRKRASIVVHNVAARGTNSEVRIFCKGGPDMLFQYTTSVINRDGSVDPINKRD